LDSRITNPD
jgi:ATP-binding cassette, subfamily D (ALD), member 3